ncbi:alpha/beta hydrolase [Nocardia uniformis]|uniref:alpha/beta hydrolase n=1 Tax=Nocardia uniformis TaxID=53432 RepID=UPI000AB4FE21
MQHVRRTVRIAVLFVAIALVGVSGPVIADPVIAADVPRPVHAMRSAQPAANGARLLAAAQGPGRIVDLTVHSEAMGRSFPVAVLPAPDSSRPAPTLYLLNGVDGGTETGIWSDRHNWLTRTDAERFLADKQVNVVVPFGGAASFFADWRADDPVLGRQSWATFLTRELPPIIDSAFGGTGINAIAGPSMAGSAVFRLALAAPGLYRAIGSYSGCVRTSDPTGQAMVNTVVATRQGDPLNMWGPSTDPAWAANDPYLHAADLRGTAIYVASGTGLPGALDTLDGPGIDGNAKTLIDQLVIGGMLDAITASCTRQLQDRFRELNIPAVFEVRPTGTHSWGYWQRDLRDSWPTLAAGLGL